jgi:hypothetical protein
MSDLPTEKLDRMKVRNPRVEFDKMLSRLEVSRETIREEEEIIETPDERTVITYDVQINPQTGAQRKVTKFSTTEQICELCNKYVARVYKCERDGCGAFVCAKHRKMSPLFPRPYVCDSCYEEDMKLHERAYGPRDTSDQERLERLGRSFG